MTARTSEQLRQAAEEVRRLEEEVWRLQAVIHDYFSPYQARRIIENVREEEEVLPVLGTYTGQ